MCQPHGHKILFTPPYHSDLQPIKLLWALVKGRVGCQYTKGTTLDQVLECLQSAFNEVQTCGHKSIEGMINKCTKVAQEFWDNCEANDLVNNDDDEESDDNSVETDSDEDENDDESVNSQRVFEIEEV